MIKSSLKLISKPIVEKQFFLKRKNKRKKNFKCDAKL